MSDALTPDQLELLLETMEPEEIRAQFAQGLRQSPECEAMLRQFEALDQHLTELKQLDPPPPLKRPSPHRGTALLIRMALPLAAALLLASIWLFETQPRAVFQASQPQAEEPFTDAAFESRAAPEPKPETGPLRLSKTDTVAADRAEPEEVPAPTTLPPLNELVVVKEETEAPKAHTAERRQAADTFTHHRGLQADVSADQYHDASSSLTGADRPRDLSVAAPDLSPPADALERFIAEQEIRQKPLPQTPASRDVDTDALLNWRERFLALSSKGDLNVSLFSNDAAIVLHHLNPEPMTLDQALALLKTSNANRDAWSAIDLPDGRPGLALQTPDQPLKMYCFELNDSGLCILFEPFTP